MPDVSEWAFRWMTPAPAPTHPSFWLFPMEAPSLWTKDNPFHSQFLIHGLHERIIKWLFQASRFCGNRVTANRKTWETRETKAKSKRNPGLLILGLAPYLLYHSSPVTFAWYKVYPCDTHWFTVTVNKAGAEKHLAVISSDAQGITQRFPLSLKLVKSLKRPDNRKPTFTRNSKIFVSRHPNRKKYIYTTQQSLTFTGPVICS